MMCNLMKNTVATTQLEIKLREVMCSLQLMVLKNRTADKSYVQ